MMNPSWSIQKRTGVSLSDNGVLSLKELMKLKGGWMLTVESSSHALHGEEQVLIALIRYVKEI